MFRFRWLNSLRRRINSSAASRRANPAARRLTRLYMETLEDRTLFSINVFSNFKGLDTTDAGGIVEPPDPIAAAGPSTVVELVNSNIAFYDKATGAALFSQALDSFFSPVDQIDSLLSDVSVTYDEQAGRFIVSTMDIDFFNLASYYDFAVSNDSNPLDGFSEMHQINTTEVSPRTGETLFTDFPRLGWNADAYLVSFSMFGFGTQNQYNSKLLTIDKASVLDKNNATLTDQQLDRPLPNSTLVPATMHGSAAGGPLWLLEEKGLEQDGSYSFLRVVKMTDVLSATPTFTDYYVPMAQYTITPFPGDTQGQVTTALDTRILTADWRNDQLVAAQNVGIASDTDVHAAWYEISTGGTAPALVQQGTLAPADGVDTYMPSVALAKDGSIGMTYIQSSPAENMSMYVTGRTAADAPGTMETGVLVKAGEQNYQGTRAGDFSGITVDPTTGTSFWAVNEYAVTAADLATPNWGTWIANFGFTGSFLRGPIRLAATTAAGHPVHGAATRPDQAIARDVAGAEIDAHSRVRGHLLLQVPTTVTAAGPARKAIAPLVSKHHATQLHDNVPEGDSPLVVSASGGKQRGGGGRRGSSPLIVKPGTSFAGLNTNDAGGIVEPPDPIAAAGPSTVVELVNSNIAFYDKATGATLFSQALDSFFAPVDQINSLLSDVSVAYDEQAGRFIVSTMDIDFFNLASYYDFAVSNDANPMDGFSEMHQINTTEVSPRTGETLFTDFPRLGWNADAYVVSFSMFGFGTQDQYNSKLLTIDKASVLDKNNATLAVQQLDRPLPNSTLVPATMHGSAAGGPLWLLEEKGLEQDGSYSFLRVVKMTDVLSATPTFTDYYVPMAQYTITPFPGDTQGQVTTALDTRILNVDWRNNQLVAAQNVGIASDTDVHAAWYEIGTRGAAPALVQQGTLAPADGVDTYMPSVALATDGSIGMTYIQSSPTENMSMYVTGRTAADAPGTMEAGVLVKAGEQNYQGTRAGDFSGITVDPTTGTSFWAVNEYAVTATDLATPNWGTWIAEFRVFTPIFSWTGAGTTNHWSDPNNWSDGIAPGPGDNLVFGPSPAVLASTNDYAYGTPFGTITLSGSGYLISGNGIALAGGLNGSGATGSNTFGLTITLSADETFQAGSASTHLTLNGSVNNNGFLLTIGGGNGFLDLANSLAGAGGLTITNSGTTTLSGPGNTFAGLTTVQTGTLILQKSSGAAVPGDLTIGAATVRLNANNQIAATVVTVNNTGLLDTNNHSNTIGPLTLSASSVRTGTGILTVKGNVTDSGNSTIAGKLALGGSPLTVIVSDSSTLTVWAVVSGAASIIKAGGGTLVLGNANTYSGGTTLTAGSLSLGNNSALGGGTLVVNGGAMATAGSSITLPNKLTLSGDLTLAGFNNLTFTGPVTLTGNRSLTVTNTAQATFSGVIGQSAGTWSLTKAGAGTLLLTGRNTYAGGTTITVGILLVNGIQPTGAVTVKSAATLGGTGTIGPIVVSSGGTVLPGASTTSTGVLNSGDATFSSGSTFKVALNGAAVGSGYDQLSAVGTVKLGGCTLTVSLGFTPGVGKSFTIVSNHGTRAVSGTFSGLAEGSTFVVSGKTFRITYKGGAGRDVVITRIA